VDKLSRYKHRREQLPIDIQREKVKGEIAMAEKKIKEIDEDVALLLEEKRWIEEALIEMRMNEAELAQ
jgi:hypothetical protein